MTFMYRNGANEDFEDFQIDLIYATWHLILSRIFSLDV